MSVPSRAQLVVFDPVNFWSSLEQLAGLQSSSTPRWSRPTEQIRAQYDHWVWMAQRLSGSSLSAVPSPRHVVAVAVGGGHLRHAGWLDLGRQHRHGCLGRLPPRDPGAAGVLRCRRRAPAHRCVGPGQDPFRPSRAARRLVGARLGDHRSDPLRGPTTRSERPARWRTIRSRRPTI